MRDAIKRGALTAADADEAIEDLDRFNVKYDVDVYPELQVGWPRTVAGESPASLAEALLWKLGKWPAYKRFVRNVGSTDSRPTNTDVVFFAFAKHLQDQRNPIYDQHAIRALCAIGDLDEDERAMCTHLLFHADKRWKDLASGQHTIACYELFVDHVRSLVEPHGDVTSQQLNRLLMPLGQALKASLEYNQFVKLCGGPSSRVDRRPPRRMHRRDAGMRVRGSLKSNRQAARRSSANRPRP